jgi:hypothetical protein
LDLRVRLVGQADPADQPKAERLMSRVIPGMGLATSVQDLEQNYRRLAAALPQVLLHWADAHVVRNQVGNLAIVTQVHGVPEVVGYIDVRTGDIVLFDDDPPRESAHME